MFKLLPYQEKLVESKSKKILCNWSHGAGISTSVAYKILKERPSSVFYIGESARIFPQVISNVMKLDENLRLDVRGFYVEENSTIIEYENGTKTKIDYIKGFYSLREKPLNQKYDLGIINFYDSHMIHELKNSAYKYIIHTTENNYDQHLQKQFSDYEFIEVDVYDAIAYGQISRGYHEKIKNNKEDYYKYYAILDNLSQIKFSYDDFKNKTLLQLQKEYNDTSKNKDTILTRKNIIDMIITLQRN